MDTKALRQKILDLAIRGKLVPQDPNDEPASVLLERIRAEKQQMVKDGKLKAKDIKNDTVIFKGDDNLHYEQFDDGAVKCIEEEIPFELPEGWSWTRIQNITQICLGLTHTPKYVESGIPFYSVKDISSGGLDTTNPKYISAAEFEKFPDGAKPQYGDILFGRVGTLGKPTIVNTNSPFGIFVSLGFFRKYSHEITSEFFVHWMNSSLFWDQVNMNVKGAVLTNLNTGWLSKFLIPIPPSKEQTRIVAQCEIAIRYLEEIENTGREISNLISATKSKILDLAIRGKLVPQNPNDEPASILLERIRAEKEELIKQGKIKRDKKESVIFKGDDNSYYEKIGEEITCIDDFLSFDIPDTWTWTRLKNIGDVIGGGTPKTNNHNYWDGEIPWVTPADLSGYKNMYIAHGSRFITELGLKESSAQLLPKDSVLFSSRAPIGYIAIAENAIATNQGFKSVSPYISGISEYLYFCLKRCTDDIIQRASGTTFKEISGSEMSETLVPIPSLNEQKKIVNRISDLFAVINNVEASLN